MSTMGYVSTLGSASEAASVYLDFEKDTYIIKGVKKKFSEVFTTVRASKASRTNAAGLFEVVGENVPRMDYDPITKKLRGILVEEQRSNLATGSDAIHRGARTRVILEPNAAVAPDGTISATKVVNTSEVDWHYVSSASFAVLDATSYTVSVYAKAGEFPRVRLGLMDNTIFSGVAVFDLTTGTRVSGSVGDITPVGNGWYRCTFTALSKKAGQSGLSVNAVKAGEVDANTAGDDRSGVYLWGWQAELGTFATTLIPTPTLFTGRSTVAMYYDKAGVLRTAAPGVARDGAYFFDSDGTTKPAGTLIEAASTNIFVSNMFESPAWGRNRVDVTKSQILAPSGVDVFRKLEISSVAGGSSLYANSPGIPAAICTESFYVKAGTTGRCSLRFFDGAGSGAMATFNLLTGTIVSQTGPVLINASISPVGTSGVYRISLTADYTSRSQLGLAVYLYVNFDNPQPGDSIYAWGAQLEAQRFPTSYVLPTPIFTRRASTATYFDAQGVMQVAGVNVPRSNAYTINRVPLGLLLELGATNLLLNSQKPTATGWQRNLVGAGATPTLIENAVTAPDNTLTATTVVFSAPDLTSQSQLSQAVPTTQDLRYVGSVFLKASTPDDVGKVVGFRHAGNTAFFLVTLTSKWQRVESTEVANSASGVFLLSLRPQLGTSMGTVNVDFWGGQLELGIEATSYVPTSGVFTGRATPASYINSQGVLASAAAGVERTDAFGFDNITGALARVGTLREAAATNLLVNSDNFSGWVNQGPASTTPLVLTAGAAAGIRGPATMTRVSRVDSTIRYIIKAFSAPAGQTVSTSVYAKAGEVGGILGVRLQSSYANRCDAWFNLVTGKCGVSGIGDLTGLVTYMTKQANGSWRCVVRAIGGSAAWGNVLLTPVDQEGRPVDGTIGSVPPDVFIDAAQTEVGVMATAYIPTDTAAVTRDADGYTSPTATRVGDVFSSPQPTRAADSATSTSSTRVVDDVYADSILGWYNVPETTLYTEFVPGQVGTGSTTCAFWLRNVADNNNIVTIRKDLSLNVSGVVTGPTGAIQAQIAPNMPIPLGERARAAMSYKLNNATISVNGSAVANDPVFVPPTPERMFIGSTGARNQCVNGWVNKVVYYPVCMAASQLQAITS